VLQYLQHIEPAHQYGTQAERQGGAGQKPAVHQVFFLFVVLERDGLRHQGLFPTGIALAVRARDRVGDATQHIPPSQGEARLAAG